MVKRRIKQWRALTSSERWLLLRLVVLLPMADIALRIFGLEKCQNLLDRYTTPLPIPRENEAASSPPLEAADRLARLVAIAARHGPYRVTCLRQSLTVCWLLRRRGISADLRIGVRKDRGRFEAHAWVEHEGIPLNEDSQIASQFAVLSNPMLANNVPPL